MTRRWHTGIEGVWSCLCYKREKRTYRIFGYTNQIHCNGCVKRTERMNSGDGKSYFAQCLRYREAQSCEQASEIYLTMHVMHKSRSTACEKGDCLCLFTFDVNAKGIVRQRNELRVRKYIKRTIPLPRQTQYILCLIHFGISHKGFCIISFIFDFLSRKILLCWLAWQPLEIIRRKKRR